VTLQQVDLTTLILTSREIATDWIPARVEQVYQRDRHTIYLCLRTLKAKGWLLISWHPQAARLCVASPPPKIPDTFTFSEQLRHQLNGLALVEVSQATPWERVLDLKFARRPQEPALWHLYLEIMGKYSNAILTDSENLIVAPAHQVNSQQSSVRPIQTGEPYVLPPSLTDTIPTLEEPLSRWQSRIGLIPGKLNERLLKTYRGLSSALVKQMIQAANLEPAKLTSDVTGAEWSNLFILWQNWLKVLIPRDEILGSQIHKSSVEVVPGFTQEGYTVMGWQIVEPVTTISELLDRYYWQQLAQQEFTQLKHQLQQKVGNLLKKASQKAETFASRLEQSDNADRYKHHADLLMANLHQWQPGMEAIALSDFETGEAIEIPLQPEKNAVQNAQHFYRQHQKLKRARNAVEPLLAEVNEEIAYLDRVAASLAQIETYQDIEDLQTLQEIREELIEQKYLETSEPKASKNNIDSAPYRYQTPSGFELLVGRNNRQNDRLTFRTAGDYDLWFHSQQIAGGHILLRLPPGAVAEEIDLQFAADLAAYYSQGRQSDRVPVVYTQPKNVYKPKGSAPGTAIYQKERVIWGYPLKISSNL
jgi:predicted ribosome quality control (RQC) complex YloA/Tae2 family protein